MSEHEQAQAQAQAQAFALQQEWRAMITSKLGTLESSISAMSATLTNIRLEVVTHKHHEDMAEKMSDLEVRLLELEKTKLKSIAVFATLNAVAVVAWAVFAHFWPAS